MVAVPQASLPITRTGYGFGGNVVFPLGRSRVVGVRLDAGMLIYGHERKRACFSSTWDAELR